MPTIAQRAALTTTSTATVLRARSRTLSSTSVARASRDSKGRATRSKRKPGTRILLTANTRAQRRGLAEGVSTELNRQLLRIDLGQLANKYIGETEKNLRSLFDSAESTGAILFFDEADALFGRRTKVKDAHDRYTNLEVSYLLQRIEDSPSVVILATNKASNIDPAFLRRLRFAIKLTPPTSKSPRRSKAAAARKP
jgi:SpoVK/Ycf46/Vps4 family AAA+-type ATPase